MVESSLGAELTLRTSDKPGSCRIYVSGPTELTLRSLDLAANSELVSFSNLSLKFAFAHHVIFVFKCKSGQPSSVIVYSGNQGWSDNLPKIKHCQKSSCGKLDS